MFTATGRYLHDPLKLVISVAGTGADGFAVDDELLGGGVRLEMADRDTLVPILTFADDRDAVERLVAAVTAAIERHLRTPSAAGGVIGGVAATHGGRAAAPGGAFRAAPACAGDTGDRQGQRRDGGALPAGHSRHLPR